MKLRNVFFLLFIVGTILPYTQFASWLIDNGLDLPLFFKELFSTRVSGAFAWDVIVSCVVFLVFVIFESRRLKMRNSALIFAGVVIGALFAGVSCGFPLFLYFRQRHLDFET